jgi:hypothetical protein
LHRVAVLERDMRVMRQQLVQVTDQLIYSRQKLDLLEQAILSRGSVAAVPNGSTSSGSADHIMTGGNMVTSQPFCNRYRCTDLVILGSVIPIRRS